MSTRNGSLPKATGSADPMICFRPPDDVAALLAKAKSVTGRTVTRLVSDCIRAHLGSLAGKRIKVQPTLAHPKTLIA